MDARITPGHVNFELDMTNYAIDASLELYMHSETGWCREVTHNSPELAFGALLQLGSLEQGPGSSTCGNIKRTKPTCHGVVEPGTPMLLAGSGVVLPSISNRPTKDEIDDWINKLKVIRKSRTLNTGPSSQAITCPLPGCGVVLTRPSALKNHLYFRFEIKPFKCVACLAQFSTNANLTRHIPNSCRPHR
ncbi:unnamed protein product [Rhizoctonia solani]|uniref:C2H2-type domain-containing protein n=1 Tax=Rhizoctonia solani TaxID=456999 RepID=A0A8H2WDM3_9AGAM|nr:unnamed protein product [Rhizoctonia solani]